MHVQNHIHLGDTLGDAPEYAPSLTWVVTQREPELMAFTKVRYTPYGAAYLHVAKQGGQPVVRVNYDYELLLKPTESADAQDLFDLLLGLMGKRLYLVDHVHPDDSEDHTVYVREVFIANEPRFRPGNPLLTFYTTTLTLKDIT